MTSPCTHCMHTCILIHLVYLQNCCSLTECFFVFVLNKSNQHRACWQEKEMMLQSMRVGGHGTPIPCCKGWPFVVFLLSAQSKTWVAYTAANAFTSLSNWSQWQKGCSWNRDTRTANAQTTRIRNWKIQLSVVSPGSPLTFKVGQGHKTEISNRHFRLSSCNRNQQ